jgi:SAM-dependent methyltransferase
MPACIDCKHFDGVGGVCNYLGSRFNAKRDSPIRKCINAMLDCHLSSFSGNLLEVGYGKNTHLRRKVSKDIVWHGTDPRWHRPKRNAPQGSSYDIPFGDEYFDVVVCSQTMEHWGKTSVIERSLVEIKRVLKLGGLLHVNVPMLSHGNSIFVRADSEAIRGLFSNGWEIVHWEEWRKEYAPLEPHKSFGRRKKEIYASYMKCGQEKPSTWVLDINVRSV